MTELQASIDISQFLFDDLTIDLEKLTYVTSETVRFLEEKATDDDVTLSLHGLEEYFKLRNVPEDNEKQRREEKIFILSFVSAVAAEHSVRDTIQVGYVQ